MRKLMLLLVLAIAALGVGGAGVASANTCTALRSFPGTTQAGVHFNSPGQTWSASWDVSCDAHPATVQARKQLYAAEGTYSGFPYPFVGYGVPAGSNSFSNFSIIQTPCPLGLPRYWSIQTVFHITFVGGGPEWDGWVINSDAWQAPGAQDCTLGSF